MKNTKCPLVKSHQKSQLSGQKNKTAGGFGIAILTGLVAIAFSGGWILAAGVSTQSEDADRLHAQIEMLKSETKTVTAAKAVVTSKLVADL